MKFRKMSVPFAPQPGISEFFGRMESALCLASGPVHTYADIFESATFSFRIRLSSTRIRRIRKQSRNFFNPLSRVGIFEYFGYVWTVESGYFLIRCRHKIGASIYLANLNMAADRRQIASVCAPWAYFQSFSLYAAKCCSTKC